MKKEGLRVVGLEVRRVQRHLEDIQNNDVNSVLIRAKCAHDRWRRRF